MSSDYSLLLRRLNLKATPKRLAILTILNAELVYLSPEDIWEKMKLSFSRIGLPTVYRNLEELASGGIITKIIHPNRRLYYYFCSNGDHHHHFICLSCNSVQELDYCPESEIAQKVRRQLKGRVVSHLLQVSGLCSECNGRGMAKNNFLGGIKI
jgi:Fe2+ or Zn2+ uptake regulation protein